jgi:hypothetical protein
MSLAGQERRNAGERAIFREVRIDAGLTSSDGKIQSDKTLNLF